MLGATPGGILMFSSLRITVLSIAFVFALSAAWASESMSDSGRPTLLIIDIQEFYFEGGAIPLEGSVAAAHAAHKVLARFRANGWPIIHVQHLPKGTDTPGQDVQPDSYRIRPEVAPQSGEVVVGKHHANAFRETDLLDRLRAFEPGGLVIVGMQTHMCLEAATRAAADLGYKVTVVGEACATRDLSFAGHVVPAAQVQASTLATLDGTYSRVVSLEDYLRESQVGE